MLKFKKTDEGYQIDFFHDVPIFVIKELKKKYKCERYTLDGKFTKINDEWKFESRLYPNENCQPFYSNTPHTVGLKDFLDDELEKYLRKEKIKKLNAQVQI